MIIRTGHEIDRGYRIGGEELVLVLEGVQPAAARTLAEALRALVAALPRGPRLTCSIGVATFPADGCDRSALVKAADTALYAAKTGCRDPVKPAHATSSGL